MKKTSDPPKFYGQRAIVLSSFFFGPLAGGYLFFQNFKKMGDIKAAKATIFSTVIFVLAVFPILFLLPDKVIGKIPNSLIPIVSAVCFKIYYDRYQKSRIEEMLSEGAIKESGWKATGIGFLCLLITFLYVAPFIFLPTFDLRTIEYNIGCFYERHEDGPNALIWFRRSADRGYPMAYNSVGLQYYWGRGVSQDYGEALSWYKKGADLEDLEAQYNIGVLFRDGQGVKQDYSEAAKWFEKAADQGDKRAQYNLGQIYMEGALKNLPKSIEWFRKAAEQGVAEAQYNLGVFYESGQGVEKNKSEAKKWYQKAADQGMAEAQKALKELN